MATKKTTKKPTKILDFDKIKPYTPTKTEEFMSDKQLQHFKNKLLAWKEKLLSGINNTADNIRDNQNNVADSNDRATLEEEFALELRTRDRESKLISKIDKTIHKLETGDYGYCDTCGAEISLPRLDARPTADECIDCKTISERKEL
jgi:DnaK suppressor protein